MVLGKRLISNIFSQKNEYACFKVIHSLAGGRPEGVSPPQGAWEDQRGWENVRLSKFHSFWRDNQGVDMKMIFQTKKAANQIKIDIKMTEKW